MFSTLAHLADAGAHAAVEAARKATGSGLGGMGRANIVEVEDMGREGGSSSWAPGRRRLSIASSSGQSAAQSPSPQSEYSSQTMADSGIAHITAQEDDPPDLPNDWAPEPTPGYRPLPPMMHQLPPPAMVSPPTSEYDYDSAAHATEDDVEELSTENSITFYQGFRAVYPKFANKGRLEVMGSEAKRGTPSSPRLLGLGLGQLLTMYDSSSRRFEVRRSATRVPEKARLHAVSINNVARLFSELLNERDSVLQESEKLEDQRNAISEELRQIEDLLTELTRRKHDMTAKLKRVVEREEKVNSLLEDLDRRVGSIGDQTASFERTIRTLKGDSKAISDVNVQEAQEEPEIAPNSCIKTLYGHKDSVECLDFDMPFGTLVTGSADKTIRVWDLSSHRCAALLEAHRGWVRTVQVRSQTLMSGSGDHTIRQWDLSRLPPMPSSATGMPSTPFSTPDPEEICVQTYRGHTGGVSCLMFDERTLISGSVDKTVRQWDMETGAEVTILRSEKWIDGVNMDGADRVVVGDLNASLSSPTESVLPAHSVSPAEISTDSGIGTPKTGFKLYNVGGHVGALQFWHHALAAGYGDGVIRLWDLRTGRCHRELSGHLGAITTLKFDQAHVVSGSVDKSVKVWDLRSGECVDEVRFDAGINDLHHDVWKITVAAGSKDVKIYNRTTSLVRTLEGHSKPVRSLRHMEDTLVSGAMDNTVKIWRI
ncbi:Mitochondrial fission protein [Borealophlyctis nickersoniae]|nr:Mitochondrial fission protein [Borealophlyctis nickersoniae]